MPAHAEEPRQRDFVDGPLYFVFTLDGTTFAASRKVSLMKGRRYPGVEHWFVLPDEPPRITSPEATRSAAPVLA